MTTTHSPKSNAAPQLQVVYQPVEALTPNPRNPRKHSKAQIQRIADSIREFGFNAPILVDGDNQVVAGHARLAAAKLIGLGEVPTVKLEQLTSAQIKAYMIADNKLSEMSSWDKPLLVEAFHELEALNFDLELTGFEVGEIDLLLGEAEKDASSEFDEIPDSVLKGPPIAKLGDIFQLGSHRVMCGSASDAEHVSALMDEQKAHLVLTDPPYNLAGGSISGLGKVKHGEFVMASGEMSPAEFTAFLHCVFALMVLVSVNGAIAFIFMDWRHLREILDASAGVFSELKNLIVWAKTNAGMGSFYRSQHELVFAFKIGTARHQNNFRLGELGRHRSNVWRYEGMNSINAEGRELLAEHPTVKPVGMLRDAILDCSSRGDIVLDPFGGSGSTLIAAEICGRHAYVMELDPKYVDLIIRRWQVATGEKAILVDSKSATKTRKDD